MSGSRGKKEKKRWKKKEKGEGKVSSSLSSSNASDQDFCESPFRYSRPSHKNNSLYCAIGQTTRISVGSRDLLSSCFALLRPKEGGPNLLAPGRPPLWPAVHCLRTVRKIANDL